MYFMFHAASWIAILFETSKAQNLASESSFPSTAFFEDALDVLGGLGLRSTASPRQFAWVEYLNNQLMALPNMRLDYNSFDLFKWQTMDDKTLYEAGTLSLNSPSASNSQIIDIAGAIPYSAPISATGQLVYIPSNSTITDHNVSGKVVMKDFTLGSIPYTIFDILTPVDLGYYRTPDTAALLNSSYSRPYTYTPEADIEEAAAAGAVGFISAFNVSRSDVQSYWDPHGGRFSRIPAVYIGVDEAERLKLEALQNASVSLSIAAFEEVAYTKEITATLPGLTKDRIIILCHTDGNTRVQDNGGIAVLALAQYFSALPLSSRNKTLQFVLTSGHLAYYVDGDLALARKLDFEYEDNGDVALILPLEHMGTMEILAKEKTNGSFGQALEFTGLGEPMIWCVGPSAPLIDAVTTAVKHRDLDRVFVMQGAGLPNNSQVPAYTSFGGIGTDYHNFLLPTSSIISGPWSLWAPEFGVKAVDANRLRNQTLAFADVIGLVSPLSSDKIAGNYTQMRRMREQGYPTVNNVPLSQFPTDYWQRST